VFVLSEGSEEEFKNGLWAGLNHEIAASRSDQSGSFRVIGRKEAGQVIERRKAVLGQSFSPLYLF
jgi:hypothetical protein